MALFRIMNLVVIITVVAFCVWTGLGIADSYQDAPGSHKWRKLLNLVTGLGILLALGAAWAATEIAFLRSDIDELKSPADDVN